MRFNAEAMRAMPKEQVSKALSNLSKKELEELQYDWDFWARDNQLEPHTAWLVWFLNCGRGFGKQVAKDTDILTHNRGWTTVGELNIGDSVYDEKGQPQEVLAFYESEPETVYEIEFDTGEKITADAEHLWTTETHYKDRKRRVGAIPDDWGVEQYKVKTTQEIVETFTHGNRKDLNHSIPCTKPFIGNKYHLPIDPYILGMWLGDGHSASGCFTNTDQEIWDRISKQFDLKFYAGITANAKGLYTELRKLGLLHNKHIPEEYLLSTTGCREELLRGLMDSDGYINPKNGCVEFCQNGSNPLAKQVLELACGLGMKASLYEGRATLYGKDCGPKYRVCWSVRDFNPFWLSRKSDVADKFLTKSTGQTNRTRQRMLKSFREVKTPDCGLRCITVTGESNLFLIGRSFIPTHNTRTGAETIRKWVKRGMKRIAAVAPTNSDIKKVMINGSSGFLAICSPHDTLNDGTHVGMPRWSPTEMTLFWYKDQDYRGKAVAKVEFFSAEEPERLRGPQFEGAWCDELAAWNRDRDTWDMLKFCLRLETRANGKIPKVIVTTTPRQTVLVRELVNDKNTHLTVGSTFDNSANLASSYLKDVKDKYEGTRLGRQELYAEVLTENEGSLWTADMIDACQISRDDLPELIRIVVSLDPATTSNVESDMTGICVAGIDINGLGYVLGDYTMKGLPDACANRVVELYHLFGASRIVYESNQGGDYIPALFKTIDPNLPLRGVHASTAKIARAEPVSALYEQGKVKHIRNPEDHEASLTELETQMCTFEPMGKQKSPDRYDAMVWALTDLMLKGVSRPKLQLIYSSTKSA